MSQIFVACLFLANPSPEIIWLHNGKEIQETEDFHFEKKGNEYSLYIQEVFPEDTGKYTCEAWNEVGESQTQATLTVQGRNFLFTYKMVKENYYSNVLENVCLKYMSVYKVCCEGRSSSQSLHLN